MSRVHERRRIYAFLDGNLSEGGYARLERHLQSCETCRRHLEQVREARSILASMGEQQVDLDWIRVRRGLSDVMREPVRRNVVEMWTRRALLVTAMAAAAVLLVVLVAPLWAPREKDGSVKRSVDGPAAVTRTSVDASLSSGRLTLVGEGTVWRRPGMRWAAADLMTVVASETQLDTGDHGVASVQLAPLSGIRVEPGSRVTFERLVRDSVQVSVQTGTVSATVTEGSGLKDVLLRTPDAEVGLERSKASVQKKVGATRVVISEGRVRVRALAGGEERLVTAPAVLLVDERGIRAATDDDQGALSWLGSVQFNLFEQLPHEQWVSFVPHGQEGPVTISMAGLSVGQAPLSMLAPTGQGEATLTFSDGSSIRTSFGVQDSSSTVVSFATPTIDVASAPPVHRTVKPPEPEEQPVADESEEPEQVHEGVLAPEIVKLVMKKNKGRLRDCYEKYLDAEPEVVKVKARILFTVGTSGKVVDSSAESNSGDDKLNACLSGAMKNVVFPPPSGGTVQFAYPITFAPK